MLKGFANVAAKRMNKKNILNHEGHEGTRRFLSVCILDKMKKSKTKDKRKKR
jgi:hypothetical protein